jgi:hypothetical protein
MFHEIFNLYFYYYKISIVISLLFGWLILSYIDRVHFRERIRRIGIFFSYILTTILPSKYLFTQLRLFILRPVCVCLEGLTGLFEGMENTEAIVKISSNKKDLFSFPNNDSTIPTIDMDIKESSKTSNKTSNNSNKLSSPIIPITKPNNPSNIDIDQLYHKNKNDIKINNDSHYDCRNNQNDSRKDNLIQTINKNYSQKYDSTMQKTEQQLFDRINKLANNNPNNPNDSNSSDSSTDSSSDDSDNVSDNTSSDNAFPFATSSTSGTSGNSAVKISVSNKQKKTVPIKLARRKCNFGK